MKKIYISIKKIITILFITLISSGLFLIACGEDEEENPVSISSIELSSSTVNTGGSITVTINATDKDDRILNYEFDADGGDFDPYEATENSTVWNAPSVGGDYTITGRAYVGNDEDTATISY
jgi:hypothetical protein